MSITGGHYSLRQHDQEIIVVTFYIYIFPPLGSRSCLICLSNQFGVALSKSNQERIMKEGKGRGEGARSAYAPNSRTKTSRVSCPDPRFFL